MARKSQQTLLHEDVIRLAQNCSAKISPTASAAGCIQSRFGVVANLELEHLQLVSGTAETHPLLSMGSASCTFLLLALAFMCCLIEARGKFGRMQEEDGSDVESDNGANRENNFSAHQDSHAVLKRKKEKMKRFMRMCEMRRKKAGLKAKGRRKVARLCNKAKVTTTLGSAV
ncbi:hypothetical protein M514_04492 [Trichuris suis]|uniref:Uncharacterized protein n=1 Tax=Trichuris suis TaxID=68888 RepID=A0A085N5Y6_9BILA|nr:hypothetical protein M513_04492 [Trichuris suis]KFD64882.1 hypothetical protein M514_04492 [Trichuris suis]